MPEEKEQEKKEEGKIVLETRIHCTDCRYQVYKTLVTYPGVDDVNINLEENKVTLKAPKVDPEKLFESVKKNNKKKGKFIKLLYPDPSEVKKKEETKKEETKPVEVIVVLKANMNCSSCIEKMEKAAWQVNDVQSVKVEGELLIVKGLNLDPTKLCGEIIKKSGKNVEVVPPKKKDDEKKDGEKKDDNTKKEENQIPQIIVERVYAPEYFSDENPNACNVM